MNLQERILKRLQEKSFPDLNKDGKITFGDVLTGRLKGKGKGMKKPMKKGMKKPMKKGMKKPNQNL
jgi:hypothetical protein